MTITGIICEYNPFHNGHAYHIHKTRQLTQSQGIICIMSGNFVQRGDCALYDKHTRAHMALLGGADLVLELPFCYAAQSARYFAKGAVAIAASTGLINTLSFGSESGNLNRLQQAANSLQQEEYSTQLKDNLRKGQSYACARAHLMESSLGAEQSSRSNNILAVEYLRALSQLHSPIRPLTIPRFGSGYHGIDASEGFMSASGIRAALDRDGLSFDLLSQIPFACHKLFSSPTYHLHHWNAFLLGLIRRGSTNTLAQYPDVSEGLENRIYSLAFQADSISNLLDLVKTKRYTYTRLSRILVNFAVGLTKDALWEFTQKGPAYLRVLGANQTGISLLKQMQKSATIPILTKPAHFRNLSPYARSMFELEMRADDLFALCCDDIRYRSGGRSLTQNPIIL